MYIYRNTGCGIYAVGYLSPDGRFCQESDHSSTDAAAARVHYLNGGISDQQLSLIVDQLASWLSDISADLQALKLEVKND